MKDNLKSNLDDSSVLSFGNHIHKHLTFSVILEASGEFGAEGCHNMICISKKMNIAEDGE